MNKKHFSISLLLASSLSKSYASLDLFDDFQRTLNNMKQHFDQVANEVRIHSFVHLKNNENNVEFYIDVPETTPVDKMDLTINSNRVFSIKTGDGQNSISLWGNIQGSTVTLNAQIKTTPVKTESQLFDEKNKETCKDTSKIQPVAASLRTNSFSETVNGRLDLKSLTVEYDEKIKQLIVTIPKIEDPNNKSTSIAIPRRK